MRPTSTGSVPRQAPDGGSNASRWTPSAQPCALRLDDTHRPDGGGLGRGVIVIVAPGAPSPQALAVQSPLEPPVLRARALIELHPPTASVFPRSGRERTHTT